MVWKCVIDHTKEEMKKNFAGTCLVNPEEFPNGCKVTIFEKGSADHWEHGEILRSKDGEVLIEWSEGFYELSEVEVYFDTRYD